MCNEIRAADTQYDQDTQHAEKAAAEYNAKRRGEFLGGALLAAGESRPAPTNQYVTENHSLNPIQVQHVETIRAAALNFLNAIDANCPRCADSTDARRKVREAMFAANASIALHGAV